MRRDVAVRMADKSLLLGPEEPSEIKLPALAELVNVYPDANPRQNLDLRQSVGPPAIPFGASSPGSRRAGSRPCPRSSSQREPTRSRESAWPWPACASHRPTARARDHAASDP